MVRIYYRKSDGLLCNRYPTDIQEKDAYIDVEDEEAGKTYSVEGGKHWAVKKGKLTEVEYKDEEYLEHEKTNQIAELKGYLSSTDYVISKLNELKLEDEAEYEMAREEYAGVLKKRKEARAKINELEGNKI